MVASGIVFLVIAYTPVSVLLIRPLEDRFPPPRSLPEFAGIIVLGGGLNSELTNARGPIALSQAGARVIEAVILARRYPNAKIVFSGGSAAIITKGIPEADTARILITDLGINPDRLIFEDKSRSTSENALFTRSFSSRVKNGCWSHQRFTCQGPSEHFGRLELMSSPTRSPTSPKAIRWTGSTIHSRLWPHLMRLGWPPRNGLGWRPIGSPDARRSFFLVNESRFRINLHGVVGGTPHARAHHSADHVRRSGNPPLAVLARGPAEAVPAPARALFDLPGHLAAGVRPGDLRPPGHRHQPAIPLPDRRATRRKSASRPISCSSRCAGIPARRSSPVPPLR